jgi:hypothetical protein
VPTGVRTDAIMSKPVSRPPPRGLPGTGSLSRTRPKLKLVKAQMFPLLKSKSAPSSAPG